VDRLTRGDSKKSSTANKGAKLSLAELEQLKVTSRDLEKKVRGHLENIAKIIVAEAKGQRKLENEYGGGALSDDVVQKIYFEKWVEHAYEEMRPKDDHYVPKYQADTLIKQ
jgi:hypothetical protein